MPNQTITIHFDLDHDVDRRVYEALCHLPEYYEETDMSRAIIRFIDSLVTAVGECEDRTAQCQALLSSLLSASGVERKTWQ